MNKETERERRAQEELEGVQRGSGVRGKVYMSVRPAVVGARLWVGEVPEKATEDDLRRAMALLNESAEVVSVTIPKDEVYGRARGWAVVRFKSDEEAAEVLLRSRSNMIALSTLQWPLIVEAWAPKEQHEASFLLTLQTEGTGLRSGLHHPPHFVAGHTLEFELCTEWSEIDVVHNAMRDKLRWSQWWERHESMSLVRPDHEKEKWKLGAREYVCVRSRLQRSLYVIGISKYDEQGIKLDKDYVKDYIKDIFEKQGQSVVERCTISEQGQHISATLRFKDAHGVMTAIRNIEQDKKDPLSPFKHLTVRHMVENSTLLVYDFDCKVTNEMLKDAFAQACLPKEPCQVCKRDL